MQALYEFDDYCSYLLAKIGHTGTRTGLRKQAAKAIQVHPTYLSHVLNQRTHLSLEQAELMNQFLEHSEAESEFFLLLVQKARAGSAALQRRMNLRISEIRNQRNQISSRLREATTINENDRGRYYQNWMYAAIHTFCSVPVFQTVAAIAKALSRPQTQVREAVDFLIQAGLVTEKNGKLQIGTSHIHLKQGDPYLAQHHQNWRLFTIRSLDHIKAEDLHYSAAVTLSFKDAGVLRERFLQFISENVDVIRKSKDLETGYVMCLDFFPMVRGA